MKRVSAFLLGVIFFGAMGFLGITLLQNESAEAKDEKPELTQRIFSMGQKIYEKQCASCHGLNGKGDGTASFLLYPKPRDLTSEYRLVSTTVSIPTDEDLFDTISRGMPGSAMPSWRHLAVKERWALVYYVRYLSQLNDAKKENSWEAQKKFATVEISSEDVIKVPTETPVTAASIQKGKDLFQVACAACHGTQGKGDVSQTMRDGSGYVIRPRDLTTGIYKGGGKSRDLYKRLMAGLPGSPMPSYNDSFSDEQIWDLIHFVQSLRKENPEDRGCLRQNLLVAHKVSYEPPTDPRSAQWSSVVSQKVPLAPLWWRDRYVEEVEIKAVHNEKKISFYLSWSDPSKDDSAMLLQHFSDGVALQFSDEEDPPFFGMGSQGQLVSFWHWKAAWQKEVSTGEDIGQKYPNLAVDWYPSDTAYKYGQPFEAREAQVSQQDPLFITGKGAGNPISHSHRQSVFEKARAQGFGTLTTDRFEGKVQGLWEKGRWHVVFHRQLAATASEDIQFSPKKDMSLALAVWDGNERDRNGQKNVSIWNKLLIEK